MSHSQRSSARVGWLALLVPAAFVLVSALGVGRLTGPRQLEARGEFWELRSGRGRPLLLEPGATGLQLVPGGRLVLTDDELQVERALLDVLPRGQQSSSLDVDLCLSAGRSYRLSVVPASSLELNLLRLEGDGRTVLLGRASGDIATESGFTLELQRRGALLEVRVDGTLQISAVDAALAPAGMSVWGDGVQLRALDVWGEKTGAAHSEHDDFTWMAESGSGARSPRPPAPRRCCWWRWRHSGWPRLRLDEAWLRLAPQLWLVCSRARPCC